MANENIAPLAPQVGDSDLNLTKRRAAALAAMAGENAAKVWAQHDGTTSATPSEASPIVPAQTLVNRALVIAAEGNTNDIVIGPTANASFVPIPPGGGPYLIEAPLAMVFDLAQWRVKSTAASQAYSVIYI